MLNDSKITAMKAHAKEYRELDGDGLYICILPTGKKIWRVRVMNEGKAKILTIGPYPAITLKEARRRRDEMKARLKAGLEAVEKPSIVRTFGNVAGEWHAKQSAGWEAKHAGTVKYKLEKYILPHIGAADIRTITAPDVLIFLRDMEKAGIVDTTRRTLNIISSVFRYAVACGYVDSNPCRDLSDAIIPNRHQSFPTLTEEADIARLMVGIKGYPSLIMRSLLLWNAYTFCRPGECRQAEWQEIDFTKKEWRIPAEKMKMRRPHIVPLPSQCMEILDRLRPLALSDKWIFPSERKGKCISNAGELVALRSMGWAKEDITPHGFRAMASTILNQKKYRPDLVERSLAHGDADKVRAVYNRAEYLEERREMMQAYADFLDALAERPLNGTAS